MINGPVTGNRQALVAIDITGGEGRSRPIEIVLDTGFTGYLTLPTEPIRQLGLRFVGQRTFELANGELFEFEAYIATVFWHGNQKDGIGAKVRQYSLAGHDPIMGQQGYVGCGL